MRLTNLHRYAAELVDLLVDAGPLTAAQACEKLEWPPGRFPAALRIAREEILPALALTIPAVYPPDWRYEVTADWQPVEIGSAYTLGLAERRLSSVLRDVDIILPQLTRGSREWRRANFLSKHLRHILSTLDEINDG